jgi:small-conductance mechanosensitive channel
MPAIEWKLYVEFLISLGVFSLTFFLLFFLRSFIVKKLSQWAAKTKGDLDDILISKFRKPSFLLVFLISASLCVQTLPNEIKNHPLVPIILKLSLMTMIFWMLLSLLGFFIFDHLLDKKLNSSSIKILRSVFRLIVLSMGLLMVLDTFGISITPLLASLGVGSVAVALAVQSTLGNLFSGFFIIIDKPVRVGDYVRLNASNTEGWILQIGWRSTRLKTPQNNIVVIPNSRLADSELTNFTLPEAWVVLPISFEVSAFSDLQLVEKLALEAAQEIAAKNKEAHFHSEPILRFKGLQESRIKVQINIEVADFHAQSLVTHEFIKLLQAKFKNSNLNLY